MQSRWKHPTEQFQAGHGCRNGADSSSDSSRKEKIAGKGKFPTSALTHYGPLTTEENVATLRDSAIPLNTKKTLQGLLVHG